MDGLEFIDRESTTFSDLGVFECYRQLSTEIYNSFGVEIPPEEVEPKIKNETLKVGGTVHCLHGIKGKAYRDAAEKIVSWTLNVWRNLWQLDKIIITGGGAVFFGHHIARVFNSPNQVEICTKGTFSNALGYLKYGCRVWNR